MDIFAWPCSLIIVGLLGMVSYLAWRLRDATQRVGELHQHLREQRNTILHCVEDLSADTGALNRISLEWDPNEENWYPKGGFGVAGLTYCVAWCRRFAERSLHQGMTREQVQVAINKILHRIVRRDPLYCYEQLDKLLTHEEHLTWLDLSPPAPTLVVTPAEHQRTGEGVPPHQNRQRA